MKDLFGLDWISNKFLVWIVEKKVNGMTKDVGTQSTPPDRSSTSPSPASTPPIKERSSKARGKEETGSPISYSIPIKKSQEGVCTFFDISNDNHDFVEGRSKGLETISLI